MLLTEKSCLLRLDDEHFKDLSSKTFDQQNYFFVFYYTKTFMNFDGSFKLIIST